MWLQGYLVGVASLGADEATLGAESNVLSQGGAAKAVGRRPSQGESGWWTGSGSTCPDMFPSLNETLPGIPRNNWERVGVGLARYCNCAGVQMRLEDFVVSLTVT